MIVDELDELHMGIVKYWHETLDQESDPSPDWRRWMWQVLFGVPCLADSEQPRLPLTHPDLIIAEGLDVAPLILFHLTCLVDHPSGPLARRLWRRVELLAHDVQAAMDRIEEKEGGHEKLA